MKQFLTYLILSVMTLSLTIQTAEAKRFGMGKSYGYSKQIAPKRYGTAPKSNAAPQATKPATAQGGKAAGQPSGASRWLGPLAGLVAGGLLASLLFGDGFQGIQLMDILIFGLIAFLLFKLFAGRHRRAAEAGAADSMASASQPAANTQSFQAQMPEQNGYTAGGEEGSMIGSALSENAEPVSVAPSWFDEKSFLEAAKHNFVEVQKAWDQGDLAEIESYCSPELFAELKAHVQPGVNHTEVDTLDAEIADLAVEGDDLIVSVRFSGFIKEDGKLHAFNEIWHLRRPVDGSGNWEIIGIQPGH